MRSYQKDHLTFGEVNPQVGKLQRKLKEKGYYNLKVDNHFGKGTEKAIYNFERDNHLRPDGKVDDGFWSLLFAYKEMGSDALLKERWPNFSTNEIVNPFFDHCPANKWEELDKTIRSSLAKTMDILQDVRSFIGLKMRITSTYRPQSKGSAHSFGKAIDSQLLEGSDKDWIQIMDWLQNDYSQGGFRAILEWAGNRPWLHLDTNFKPDGFYVMHPDKRNKRKMAFKAYEGKLPYDYI